MRFIASELMEYCLFQFVPYLRSFIVRISLRLKSEEIFSFQLNMIVIPLRSVYNEEHCRTFIGRLTPAVFIHYFSRHFSQVFF